MKRRPDRATYDRATVHAILDEAFVCHVGFSTDDGPVVIPTAYGRVGDRLYLHGSPASRLLRTLKAGVPVCVTVTLLDGLVLARSTTHHSLNYRSVVVFGTAEVVEDPSEKAGALAAFVDHVVPGRSAEARPASVKDVQGTLVLSLALSEVSAKVRSGPPVDEEQDLALPVWAGEVPLSLRAGAPVAAPDLDPALPVPGSVSGYRR